MILNDLIELFDMRSELDIEAAESNIKRNTNFRGMNIWILACAIVIASLGLNVNSTAVIIGAMLISPLMGPIIGFGLAVGTFDIQLMKTTLRNLGIMVAISLIFSTLFFLISPLNMQHPSELLARTRPTIFDVLIAFVGGMAGALETSRKEKGTVISGVAIATALMPPLCTVGYGLSILDFKIATGAFYLFFINIVFVALATFLVVKYLGFPKVSHLDEKLEKRARLWASAFIIVLVVPSVFSAVSVVRENRFNTKADAFVTTIRPNFDQSAIYDYKTDLQSNPQTLTLFVAGSRFSDADRELIYTTAEKEFGIARHQIIFEMALAGDRGELEKQVYSDMNKTIDDLRQKVREYESLRLPSDQISNEVKALYPDVLSIDLARSESAIFAIIRDTTAPDSTGTRAYEAQLRTWLQLRLGEQNVTLVPIN